MFSSGPSYQKLKTNLRLSINRLKLLEKKKTELALKARKEIADYISAGKIERAKIRVEHIVREDYLVEAMEVTEMYCDLVLGRFGLVQQMKDLDPGLSEAISSLIWVAPRIMTDVPELKVVADQLTIKYGKPYAMACREQSVTTISEKLMHKLSIQAPPKVLVEKYLQEIATNYNLEYTPDPQIMREADWAADPLIDLENSRGGNGGGAVGGGFSAPPHGGYSKAAEAMASGELQLPSVPGAEGDSPTGFVYPPPAQPFGYPPPAQPFGYPPPAPAVEPTGDLSAQYPGMHQPYDGRGGPPPKMDTSPPPPYASLGSDNPSAPQGSPSPPHSKPTFPPDMDGAPTPAPRGFTMPELPSVPDLADEKPQDDEIDFDDLDKRFQQLKKK